MESTDLKNLIGGVGLWFWKTVTVKDRFSSITFKCKIWIILKSANIINVNLLTGFQLHPDKMDHVGTREWGLLATTNHWSPNLLFGPLCNFHNSIILIFFFISLIPKTVTYHQYLLVFTSRQKAWKTIWMMLGWKVMCFISPFLLLWGVKHCRNLLK